MKTICWFVLLRVYSTQAAQACTVYLVGGTELFILAGRTVNRVANRRQIERRLAEATDVGVCARRSETTGALSASTDVNQLINSASAAAAPTLGSWQLASAATDNEPSDSRHRYWCSSVNYPRISAHISPSIRLSLSRCRAVGVFSQVRFVYPVSE